jgi:hypothetical protein
MLLKKLFYFFVFLFLVQLVNAQTFSIGHLQSTFTDTSRSNRQIPCEIYYPSTLTGNNTPIAAGQFPVLVFGHGFVISWSAYDIYWQTLVPEGFIIVFPTTESSFAPSHLNFGKDLAYLTQAMKAEGINSSSLLYGAVDSSCAVMGHSMGGGCAFLAMQYDSSITAFATVAAAVTNPSSVVAANSVIKPGLVFSGANDCVAPSADHQLPMYDSLSSVCKSYISITGGDHCQFASYNFNCSFGQSACSPQATINASTQQSIMFSHLLPWLNFYLKNNCTAGDDFQNLITMSSGISSQQNCTLNCNTTGVNVQENLPDFTIECPTTGTMTLIYDKRLQGKYFSVNSAEGRTLLIGILKPESTVLDIHTCNPGLYFIYVEGNKTKRFLIEHR